MGAWGAVSPSSPPQGPVTACFGVGGLSFHSSGVGRTGAFCLLYAAMQEVEAGNGIPDLAQLVKRMRQQRKHMLQEKVEGPREGWEGGEGVEAPRD